MTIAHGTLDRNTKAYTTEIGPVILYFSYSTMVGVDTGTQRARRDNEWGPTTDRHISEFGLRDATVLNAADLESLAELALRRYLEDRGDA